MPQALGGGGHFAVAAVVSPKSPVGSDCQRFLLRLLWAFGLDFKGFSGPAGSRHFDRPGRF